jgi:hypothetical protein
MSGIFYKPGVRLTAGAKGASPITGGGKLANSKDTDSLPKPPEKACPLPGPSHGKSLLDEALEETFPASDPIVADLPEEISNDPVEQHVERELDMALEMTFPASDPIAISAAHPCGKPDVEPPGSESAETPTETGSRPEGSDQSQAKGRQDKRR